MVVTLSEVSGQLQSHWKKALTLALEALEQHGDRVSRELKHVLPHVACFFLVSTFFEDGIRMWVQWDEQREYMNISWGCGWLLATLFILVNLFGQLGGVAMVLFRHRVNIACAILFGIIFLQTIAYRILWNSQQFLFRNLANIWRNFISFHHFWLLII